MHKGFYFTCGQKNLSTAAPGRRLFQATPREVTRDRLRALASWKPEAIVAVGCAAALAFMLVGAVLAGGAP